MRKLKSIALCAFTIITICVSHTGCRSRQAAFNQNVSLRTTMDSLSYAWGVAVTHNGLVQHLQQMGVLCAEKTDTENAPRLNEFLRGLNRMVDLDPDSPYVAGIQIGSQLAQMIIGVEDDAEQTVNRNLVLAGLTQVLRNQPTIFTASEADDFVNRTMEALREAGLMEQFGENRAAGKAFLAENARRPDVITLPSGLQYEILREGHGAIPTLTDRVRVHYHGTLIDGTVFDSSMDRGQDITFPVDRVIDGWTEMLQLMPVGSKWRVWIPYDLAYGSQDRGIIRPFSVLIFDVELLGIE